MKRILAFLTIIFCSQLVFAQSMSLPETPGKVEFANVIVNLDNDTKNKVDNLILNLLTPENAYLDAKLQRMQWYFPIIEQILEEEGVPDDLKYLAVQESNLIPDALSSSGAVGFWQFKEPTAAELGLVMNREVDERKYIFESTKAAARYFKKNNIIFKNWLSCIYAYNQGPTGASKEIPDYWSYASEVKFDKNTPEYLIKALAHRIAFEHRLNRLKDSPRAFIIYPTRAKSLAEIAVELTVDLSELREYNAWLYAPAIPAAKDYNVVVPVNRERLDEVLDKVNQRRSLSLTDKGFPILKRLTISTTSDEEPIFYEINGKKGILAQPGDEAAQLAKKGNVSLGEFLTLNDLTDRDMIKTGRVYYLEKKDKKGPVEFHTAGLKQNFWDVSQMYGIRLKKLLKYNRLKVVEQLQPGRVVWLQRKRPKNKPVEIIKQALPQEENKPQLPVQPTYTPKETTEVPLDKPVVMPKKELEEKKPVVIKQEEPEEEKSPVVVKRVPETKPVIEKKPVKEEVVNKPSTSVARHTVGQGETLFSIAKRYNTTVAELRRINGMSSNSILQYGQELIINPEIASEQSAPVRNVETNESYANPEYHTVSRGQTLFSISKMYGLSVSQLQSLNGISGTNISVGQKLIVNKAAGSSQKSNSAFSYTVKKGDTLFSIAKRNDLSVADLKRINNLSGNTISVGQVLRVR
ncbi:LysM peptidoglycan-binding domain-containing protein [Jiulongibacter sp. NS-SX5]|uniref:LysM peptidoglycan-binding domain-containing protein n=1 Tax=Jiulongibacter sp. NS-SX5 TaxID=3463854 RepID=UPI00405903E3